MRVYIWNAQVTSIVDAKWKGQARVINVHFLSLVVCLQLCPQACYYQVFWKKTPEFSYTIFFSPDILCVTHCSDLTFFHSRVHRFHEGHQYTQRRSLVPHRTPLWGLRISRQLCSHHFPRDNEWKCFRKWACRPFSQSALGMDPVV